MIMAEKELKDEITWRGSRYKLIKVEDDRVTWENPVSRHSQECSVEAWRANDPYDGKYDGKYGAS
jgi:hypothetical protein